MNQIEDKLISFVKSRPELYNQRLPEYIKKKDKRLEVFEAFGKSLDSIVDGETLLSKNG